MNKYIATFKTMSLRFGNLYKVIESFMNQSYPVEKIVITISRNDKKGIEDYKIDNYKKLYDKVEVQIVDFDYGPNTKVYGALKYYKGLNEKEKENLYMVICDDDIEYDKDLVQSYDESVKNNDEFIYTQFSTEDRLKIPDFSIHHVQGADSYLFNKFFLNINIDKYISFITNCFLNCHESIYQDDYLVSYYICVICKLQIKSVANIKRYKNVPLPFQLHLNKKVAVREQKTIEYLRNLPLERF
jgi:hypothetical protein